MLLPMPPDLSSMSRVLTSWMILALGNPQHTSHVPVHILFCKNFEPGLGLPVRTSVSKQQKMPRRSLLSSDPIGKCFLSVPHLSRG